MIGEVVLFGTVVEKQELLTAVITMFSISSLWFQKRCWNY